MNRWRRFGYGLILSLFALHLGLISLYALPSSGDASGLTALRKLTTLRDRAYVNTPFRQGWPLFASYYPLDTNIGVSVKCRGAGEDTYSNVTTPIWQYRSRSFFASEHWTTYRLSTSFNLPYFRYARLQAQRGEPTDYADFFNWLADSPRYSKRAHHVFGALAVRHCQTQGARATPQFDIQLWACPLPRWKDAQREPCTFSRWKVRND